MPIQLDGSHSVERAGGTPRPAITPGEVPTDAAPPDQMGGIIRAVYGESANRAKMRLDEIQPTRVRGRGDDGDPVRSIELPKKRVSVGVEIIHDHVQALPTGIAGPQPPKGRQNVPGRLPAPTDAHKAVVVYVVEPQELLGTLGAAVGGPLASRMLRPGQSDARDWPQLQGAPLVEADYHSTPRPPLVEMEDARFFVSNAGSGEVFQVLSR